MKQIKMSALAVILLFTALLAAGCLKNDKAIPIPSPNGKFDGQFRVLRRNPAKTGFDTIIRSNIRLTIKPDSGFKVSGDTSKHAASHGTFDYNLYYIHFDDVTYTDTAKKRHLNNLYRYYYDGNTFQIARNYNDGVRDTLKLQYELTRASN